MQQPWACKVIAIVDKKLYMSAGAANDMHLQASRLEYLICVMPVYASNVKYYIYMWYYIHIYYMYICDDDDEWDWEFMWLKAFRSSSASDNSFQQARAYWYSCWATKINN
jgi:hypothetical protein